MSTGKSPVAYVVVVIVFIALRRVEGWRGGKARAKAEIASRQTHEGKQQEEHHAAGRDIHLHCCSLTSSLYWPPQSCRVQWGKAG